MIARRLLLCIALVSLAGCDMCGNEVFQEKVSPDKEYKAVVFERNCGATTGFSTQISILNNTESLLNSSGNIFRIYAHPRETQPEVIWVSDKNIEVKYKIIGDSYLLETEYEDIDILYSNK